MTTLKWDTPKDPDDTDAFQVEWEDRLTSETLVTSTWTIDPAAGDNPLVEESTSNTTSRTTIWLSGGDDGETYELTNRITTTAGRQLDQTVRLKVASR
jgi:hypothetical protein